MSGPGTDEAPPPFDPPIRRYFNLGHLPEDLQAVSKPFQDLAREVVGRAIEDERLGNRVDRAEVVTCLRKLLEAKDAAVRAALP